MTIDVAVTTSAEEDLESLTRSRWEVSLISPEAEMIGERQPIAPPTSQNTVSWKIDAPCLAGGVNLWRDGRWFKSTWLDEPAVLRRDDTLVTHYNLSVC